MNDITALMATMKAAAEKAIEANDRLCVMPPDEIFDVSLAHSKQLDADITLLNAHYDESTPANVLALVEALESRTVKLPPRVDSSNVPFTAHTWNCCLDAVEKCLAAAGIQVIEGEE